MSADPQTLQPADTSAPQEKPILSIYNFHVPDCGKPPAIEVRAETKGYYGYFVNLHGEQWILTYDFDTETGILRGGDAGWQNMCAFLDGQAPGVTLNEEERIWLRACWEAINETRKVRDDRRQASGIDLKGRPRTSWKTITTEGTSIMLSCQAGRRYLDGALLVAFHPQPEEDVAEVGTADRKFHISHDDFARLMEG